MTGEDEVRIFFAGDPLPADRRAAARQFAVLRAEEAAEHVPSARARRWAMDVLGRAADGWMVSPLSARGGVGLRVAEIVVPAVVERLEAVAAAREAALGEADVERERAALADELDAEGARVRAALRGEP